MINIFKELKNLYDWKMTIRTSGNYVNYLRKNGVRIGENVTIYDRNNIIIDLTRPWLIEIGNNVEITAGATILTHGYDWCVFHHRDGDILGSAGKVKIGNNIFIGINTTILQGTTIEDNVIIGAGSTVKGVLKANSVYVGSPAKRVCSIDEYKEKRIKLQLEEATLLAVEHKKVYGCYPKIEDMNEFFYLFENDIDTLNPVFIEKLKLRGNYEISSKKFKQNKPMFENYNAFLKHCDLTLSSEEI